MENLELRIQKLEKKYRTLKNCVILLTCFAAYAGISGLTTISHEASAQEKTEGQQNRQGNRNYSGNRSYNRNYGNRQQRTGASSDENSAVSEEKRAAGVPVVVEAEAFILKDSFGRIRGVWTADDEATTFALMHKDKLPIMAMAVDNKNASLSLTDVYSGKISLSLNNSVRSISVSDDTRKNNIYLGLTGSGEAAFDMVSTGSSSVVIDGATSSIDMTGDTAILALAETVGSTVALKAQPASSTVTFMDYQNNTTFDLSTVDGKTQMKMNSPAVKEEKVITTTAEETLSMNAPVTATVSNTEKTEPEKKEEEKTEKKEDNKVVNMKTYSPFAQ